jgi:hypothetical protein
VDHGPSCAAFSKATAIHLRPASDGPEHNYVEIAYYILSNHRDRKLKRKLLTGSPGDARSERSSP